LYAHVNVAQAVGGAVAVAVGTYILNSAGSGSTKSVSFGRISVRDSHVAVTQSIFSNCSVSSLTDSSQGSSSVFGGAFALLHSPQVSDFILGLLQPLPLGAEFQSTGSNLTVLIYKSNFSQCLAFSNATSGHLGSAIGGGGATYAKSVAMTNFSVTMSAFINNTVKVASGATGLSSTSSGGALDVEAFEAALSVVISRSSFESCSAGGADILNQAVLGGAVHVSRASSISVVDANFKNCSVTDTASGDVVSGGAAVSAALTRDISIDQCVFDGSGGQDESGTSAGLLVLSRNSSFSVVDVSRSTFNASEVVLRVQCVSEDGVGRVGGLCVGPHVLLKNSTLYQVASQALPDFNATGSAMMSLQNPASVSFAGTRMHCANAAFSAFKLRPDAPSAKGTEYSCKPCQTFEISLSANSVFLEQLDNATNVGQCIPVSDELPLLDCPYAVKSCKTFVRVLQGFWTNFSEAGKLDPAQRCPRGYCACRDATDGSCALPPPLAIDRKPHALCSGNRTGRLCGGCPPSFTQSMDDRSCIGDETCSKNLWWVWTLSVLGYAAYSLYIVVSCHKRNSGAFSCLLFYFQNSSFAVSVDESNGSSAVLEYAQVHSIVALYEGACYARSTGAYDATVFKLVGPLLVLLFALAWTWIIQKLQPRLLQRGTDISVSYSGSIAVAVLYVFSSVANVVFTLAECSSYTDTAEAVVFIDGTVPCKDAKWTVVVVFAALLFVFPALFAAALRLEKLSQSARDAVCSKFTEPVYYWGAVTLFFRLLMSVTQFLRVDFPNLLAFVRSLLSTGAIVLLVNLRPYVDERTFWVDVVCYACLIVQFGLQIFSADREFLGVAETLDKNRSFSKDISTLSTIVR
jgi:hypothetical protein